MLLMAAYCCNTCLFSQKVEEYGSALPMTLLCHKNKHTTQKMGFCNDFVIESRKAESIKREIAKAQKRWNYCKIKKNMAEEEQRRKAIFGL